MLESMAGSTGSLAVSAGELGKNAPHHPEMLSLCVCVCPRALSLFGVGVTASEERSVSSTVA